MERTMAAEKYHDDLHEPRSQALPVREQKIERKGTAFRIESDRKLGKAWERD